ncbi:unnamed protein product [Cylicocyclus nassatus]|uniref:Uncharacterized protein n=1 Tax=Cylicocyclus nassatus TaxID=53992 RepID=A0AA36GH54_CYLNA|nr:unnamed protein product [Cylicocyclus nassatus]
MASAEDVQKKLAQFQENVNKKALIDWVRITGLPNPRRRKLDRLLEDFTSDILKYTHGSPFSWPVPAGNQGGLLAIRARITYDFWKFFMQDGRKNLYEYNNTNGTDIKISREKTITLEDQERLGLYIRKRIKDEYRRINKKCIEVTLKKVCSRLVITSPSNLPLQQYCWISTSINGQDYHWINFYLKKKKNLYRRVKLREDQLSVEHSEEKENDEQDRPSTSKKRTSDHDEDEPVQKKRLVQ